ncbi:protein SFI1 homolog [Melanerpes formicivorus]|uniref:protein SFI1 homolog n=1 Tax=Melanerpes formicivorus TaxID=211600 RepID=UPI00358E16BF
MEQYRSRYLARKFFFLWAKKTFGEVLPSIARCFYDQKILQKTFGEWKEWWTASRERKLSLRAASHDSHLLPKLVFKAWRAYVCQQQEKGNKYSIAESHAKKQALLRTWQCWLAYVGVQRTKHGMQRVALAFRERSCLRIPWAVWRRRHQQSCAGRKMDVLALQHWAQSLQIRAWLQWRELYLHRQKDKQKEMRAVTHHRCWELKRCMEAWLGYLNLQKAKKLQNELAQEHHRSRLAWQCFSAWCLSWEYRRRMRAHQEDMKHFAARIALWRAFAPWKHYVVLCVEETRQCQLAEDHYRHHLLKLGLRGLYQNMVSARLQQMRRNLSVRQHQVTLLQKCWSRWKSRLEEKEEEQQQALTSVAHARYRRVLMRQVFDTWLLKAGKLQEYRMGKRKAVLHSDRQLLRHFWCLWRGRTAARLEEREGLVRARDHYSNLLLLKAFCLWKQNTQERITVRLKEMQALRFHNSKCLQQMWNKWRKYVGHQREKWRKLVQADVHYQHTLLGRTLAAWKSYQGTIQCILQQAAEREQHHSRLLLRQILHTWRKNTLALMYEAKADEHYRRAVLAKVLLQWRQAALLQTRCHQQKVVAVMEARKHLDIARLQTLFLHWKELTRESLMLRARQHRAVQHHHQHLLQKYLVKWKRHHQQCLGKVLLQRQGDQLRTRRLCSASFACWKTRLLQQQWEKQKTVQALWHWSLWLQRKVFDAWLRFAREQQQKKVHTENAAGAYHTALLREGVTPALRYTTNRKQLHGQLQAQHQLKKQVTFEVPAVSPETRGHSAEEEPCSRRPFQLTSGGSALSHLSEAPFQQTSVNRCSAQSGALMPAPQLKESLSGRGSATASHPALTPPALGSVLLWTRDVCRAGQSPEPWPPSPLLLQMKAGAEMRGDQPVSGLKGTHFQDSQQDSVKLQPNWQPHLLSPEDLVGKWSHQTAVPCIFHSAGGEERQRGCREALVLEGELETELRHIQQQLQYYFSRKQELKFCQQQAQILQKWLEMSMQPGWMFKGLDGVQGVQEELDQLQARISTLSKAQGAERQHVQILLARLRHIQIALDL